MDIENIPAFLDRDSEVGDAVDAVFTFAPTCNVSAMSRPSGTVCELELTSPISPILLWLEPTSLG